MTVDEVARAAGTTSRNVRSYQTRGLLPKPKLSGRVGLYGRLHLARLKLIAGMQKRGYSLTAISDLFRAFENRQTVGELLGLEKALTSTRYRDEREVVLSRDEVLKAFPSLELDLELFARAVELELVIPIPPEPGADERYRVPSPRLLEVGRTLLEVGVPAHVALDELASLREHARAIASSLIALFTTHVWDPWVAAGRPLKELPGLINKIRKLQPAPTRAVGAVLAQALDREISRTLGERLKEARGE